MTTKSEKCKTRNGTGLDPNDKYLSCLDCSGMGEIYID
jgi:DnaJ-class molecular chaperone